MICNLCRRPLDLVEPHDEKHHDGCKAFVRQIARNYGRAIEEIERLTAEKAAMVALRMTKGGAA